MKNITKLLLFTALCTIMVSVTLFEKSDLVSNVSILKLRFASAQTSESSTTCYRIKTFCSCYSGNVWTGMKITECEKYELRPPLVCDQCVTSSCPPGSSC